MIMDYKAEIKLYNSYFDLHDRLSLRSILVLFQDAASCHAEQIGIGYQDTLDKGMFWVLSRMKFDILRMPIPNETVTVETWPLVKGRIDFDRDFRILDKENNTIITGTSKWCVIDSKNRSLAKTDMVNYNGEYLDEKLYEDKFRKIMLPKEEFTKVFDYDVRYSDLDHNGHMNNTYYANIVSSAIENKQVTHMEINYVHECRLGDTINVYHFKNEDGEYVIGKKEDEMIFVAKCN